VEFYNRFICETAVVISMVLHRVMRLWEVARLNKLRDAVFYFLAT